MLILETSACSSASVLATILFIKKIIKILSIIVPAILVLLISIDIGKAVIANSDEDIKKAQSIAIRRIIAGVVIFFIPIIVNASFKLLDNTNANLTATKCYNNATDENVEKLAKEEQERSNKKRQEIKKAQEKANKDIEKRQQEAKKAQERAANKPPTTATSSTTCTNCTNAEKIATTAERLAWKEGTAEKYWDGKNINAKKWSDLGAARPTQDFQDAMDKWFPDHFDWSSHKGHYGVKYGACCCHAVRVVLSETMGKKMPNTLSKPTAYDKQNGFTVIKIKKYYKGITNELKRGDVLTVKSPNNHTLIFLGKSTNGDYLTAEAGLPSTSFFRKKSRTYSNLENYIKKNTNHAYIIRAK